MSVAQRAGSGSHMHVDTATPATTIARAPKRAKQSEPFGPEGSFPDHGVTLDFLRRFRRDPRLRTAMADLPLVLVVDIDGVPKARLSKPPTARRLGRLADAELRGLARQYRAFSAMDAVAEEAMYGASPSGGPPVFKACTKRHPLIAVQDDDDGGSCDHCGDAIPAATLQHGCETCGFYVCAACHGERTPINGREELLAVLRAPPTTTAHINLCIVRPDTLDARSSYARLMLDRGGEEAAVVGRPTVFVSHAWRYSFLETIDSLLERFEDDPKSDEVRVWNDIFVEDQNSSDAKPDGYFFNAFKSAIAAIGHTVLVLSPWDNPIPLTRAWCLWEIYSTLVAPGAGATLEIVLPKAEVAKLRTAVLTLGADAVTNVMIGIDAHQAECFMPSDRDRIFEAIAAMEGGVHRLNVEVKTRLRAWVMDAVRDLCADPGWTDDGGQRARLFCQVGTVLGENDDIGGAMEHYRQALAIYEAAANPDMPAIATVHNNIGAALEAQGDLSGALARYTTALQVGEQALEPGHLSIAVSHNNIAGVLEAQGDALGALARYKMALRMQELAAEPALTDVARSHNNIAAVLEAQGDLPGALARYELSLRIGEQALEPGHPDIAISHDNIAGVLEAQGDLSRALQRYETALLIREAALGPDHPDIMESRSHVEGIRNRIANK